MSRKLQKANKLAYYVIVLNELCTSTNDVTIMLEIEISMYGIMCS